LSALDAIFLPQIRANPSESLLPPWHIRLDNFDYTIDEYLGTQDTRDRATGAGEQLIIDTTLAIVEKHKNLPPGEKEAFALAFKKVNDTLASH
jgi:hypothetical protein